MENKYTAMNVESALNYICSLVSETRPVDITAEHRIAYKVLRDSLYPSEDLLFDNNRPFANLYIYSAIQLANRYNVNIDSRLLLRELGQIIDQPFHVGVERLVSNMNDRMSFDLLEINGFPKNLHPLTPTIRERDEMSSNLIKSLELACNHDAFMGKSWSYEEVERGVRSSIIKILRWNRAN